MRQTSIRIARGKAYVTISCSNPACEGAETKLHSSGVVAETHSFEIPVGEGRPRRAYLFCSRCQRAYQIIIFCTREVTVKSLDAPDSGESQPPLLERSMLRAGSDDSLGP